MSNQVFSNSNRLYRDDVSKPFPLPSPNTIAVFLDDEGNLSGIQQTILTPSGDMFMVSGSTLTASNLTVDTTTVDNIICETITAKTADIVINSDMVMLGGTTLKADTINQNVASATLILNELNIGDNSWRFFIDSGNPKIQFNGGDFLEYDRILDTLKFQTPGAPQPELEISNGLICINAKLQLSQDVNVFLEKVTTGPDQDLIISGEAGKLIRYDTSENNWEFDNSGTINLKVDGGNNRIEINNLLFSGLNQSVLSSYQQTTLSTTWSGAIPTTGLTTVALIRVGSAIVVRIPTISTAGNSTSNFIFSDIAIPVEFRPLTTVTFIIQTQDNTAFVGRCTVQTSGIFNIFPTVTSLNFNADANLKGFQKTSFSYSSIV